MAGLAGLAAALQPCPIHVWSATRLTAGSALHVLAGFDAEDLLSQMFGGAMRSRAGANAVKRGAAIHTQISIPFMDAVNGTTRQVTVYANVRYWIVWRGVVLQRRRPRPRLVVCRVLL